MRKWCLGIMGLFVFGVSCQKEPLMHNLATGEMPGATTSTTTFTTYKIRAGQHYCDQNTLKSISTSQMNFVARFNNSAIYTTVQAVNQFDINKDEQYNKIKFYQVLPRPKIDYIDAMMHTKSLQDVVDQIFYIHKVNKYNQKYWYGTKEQLIQDLQAVINSPMSK